MARIELSKVKFSNARSQENFCFTADVLIDGKKAGTASCEGRGDMVRIEPATLYVDLTAHAKSQKLSHAEDVINDLMEDYAMAYDMKRMFTKRILFTKAGSNKLHMTKPLPAAQVATVLKNEAALRAQLTNCDKILNLLPEAEALEIWKATAE